MLRTLMKSLNTPTAPKYAVGDHIVAYRIHDTCIASYHGVVSAVKETQQGLFGSRYSYRVRAIAESRSPLAPHEATAFASQIVTHGDASLVYYDAAEKSVRGFYDPKQDAVTFIKQASFRAVPA